MTIEAAGRKLAISAEHVWKAILFKLPFRFLEWAIIAFVVGLGILLEHVRRWIITWLAPEAVKHAHAFAIAADVTIDTLNIMREIIMSVQMVIQSILAIFHRGETITPLPHFAWAKVSAANVTNAAMLVQACSDFTAGNAIEFLVKASASPKVCPAIRSVKKIKYLNETLPAVDWLSWDAEPRPGNNCVPHEYAYGVDPLMCSIFQTGGIMLEVVLPIVAVVVVGSVCGSALLSLFWNLLRFLWECLRSVGRRLV